jgi:hypothetical protein
MPIELIGGLFIQLLVWLVVRTFRLVVRALRSALFVHPLLTLLIFSSVRELGWWVLVDPALAVWMLTWYPLIAIGLALIAIAKFVGEGGPTAVGKEAFRAGRFLRDLALWTSAASVLADEGGGSPRERVRSWWRRRPGAERIETRRAPIEVREVASVGPGRKGRS